MDELRDKSFAAYVKATVGGEGFGIRALAAALLSAGLIVSQGTVGLIVVLAALIGAPTPRLPALAAMGAHIPFQRLTGYPSTPVRRLSI